MNLDIIESTKEGEITQFLCDVRDYFKASLKTSEYENTSNMFYITASETTEKLLNRCEGLINRLNIKSQNGPTTLTGGHILDNTWVTDSIIKTERKSNEQNTKLEDVSYLDMSAVAYKHNTNEGKITGDSNKVFRCSTVVLEQNKSFLYERHGTMTRTTDDKAEVEEEVINKEIISYNDNIDNNLQIYDTCQIRTQGSEDEDDEIVRDDKPNILTSNIYCSLSYIDCPYIDLPAGHLSIYKSTKYGQLQKIEKRLFFDQSKKCYCGILNDWLLCYADGPTSSRPTICLYLKMPNIEVEHFGEGKRRDVCFQILTCDINKKFLFQAINEIDAKEWIHAIETAIRSDMSTLNVNNSFVRKLPTPPVIQNITFLSSFQRNYELPSINTMNDGIYEEPSSIEQSRNLFLKSSSEQPPELPSKLHIHSLGNNRFEYDVPKSPVQLLENVEKNKHNQSEPNYVQPVQELNIKTGENLDFQAIVKDVHNKLSSQLSSVSYSKKPLKKSLTSLLKSDGDSSCNAYSLASSPVNEMKNQNKLTPNTSPRQKAPNEKTSFSKNWFLNKINKSNSSTKSNPSSPSNSPSKCKQSEKENLLNSSNDACNGHEISDINSGNNPTSAILKTNPSKNNKSKVNMIINQLEASGHLSSIFNADTVACSNSFCDNDYNNYEPIMTVSIPPINLIKKKLDFI